MIENDWTHRIERPPDDAVLWRYMTLERFIWMLRNKALYFARADRLGDPFEGSLPRLTSMSERWFAENHHSYTGSAAGDLTDFRRGLLKRASVSCWHESSYESAAMWKLYGRERGIAIETTGSALRDALESSSRFLSAYGRVRYIDFDTEHEVHDNFAWIAPFFWKRLSYEHEKEVRALVYGDGYYDSGPNIPEVAGGAEIEVDPVVLVNGIRVSPGAEDEFVRTVEWVVERSGCDIPVTRSILNTDAFF